MRFLKLDIQLFAHHKGQGSTSNGRDSAGRRLGAKAADGEFITAGSIIYRQRGTKVFPGVVVEKMIQFIQLLMGLLNLNA